MGTLVQHPRHWNRHNKLRTPLARISQLRHNLILKVPRQNQNIIPPAPADLLPWVDRNVWSRQETPMLVRIPIHGELQEVLANTAIIQQRISFPWRAISGNALPLATNSD